MLQLCTTLQHGVHAKSGVTGPAHLGLCIHVGATLQQQPSALQVAIAHGRVQRRAATLRACRSQVARTGRRGISVSMSKAMCKSSHAAQRPQIIVMGQLTSDFASTSAPRSSSSRAHSSLPNCAEWCSGVRSTCASSAMQHRQCKRATLKIATHVQEPGEKGWEKEAEDREGAGWEAEGPAQPSAHKAVTGQHTSSFAPKSAPCSSSS